MIIDGKEVLNRLAVGAICAGVTAVVMAFYGHYVETKDHTDILKSIRQSSWASCRVMHKLAGEKTAAPCYTKQPDQEKGD
jgi:hypothetical protein